MLSPKKQQQSSKQNKQIIKGIKKQRTNKQQIIKSQQRSLQTDNNMSSNLSNRNLQWKRKSTSAEKDEMKFSLTEKSISRSETEELP